MPTYLAITIGPMTKTLELATSTRELWCASFCFSLLMKHTMAAVSKIPGANLLSPAGTVTQPLHGAGVYPDRCFFELAKSLTETDVNAIKENALRAFAGETGIASGLHYFQIYMVQASPDNNPIRSLNGYLDSMELQTQYHPAKTLNWDDYWNNPNTSKSAAFFQQLYKKGYTDDDPLLPLLKINDTKDSRRFPSIPEISTRELEEKDKDRYWGSLGYAGIKTRTGEITFKHLNGKYKSGEPEDPDAIISELRRAFPDDFRFRHKYFSIVYADGDHVGALINSIVPASEKIGEFSTEINKFAKKAADLLVQYGAFPVYIGGDDLLFFAPLTCLTPTNDLAYAAADGTLMPGHNIFFLLSRLDREFRNLLEPMAQKFKAEEMPSLSFGVMAGYYKHPMAEVLSTARSLLFGNAKLQPGKNYIAMQVQKHSGQQFNIGFKQQGPLYEAFLQLSIAAAHSDTGFLNSFMYKLDDQKHILGLVAPDVERLHHFMLENFNEAVHRPYEDFFKNLELLIRQLFTEYAVLNLDSKMEKLYGALRFIHLINAKDSHD